MEKSVSSKMELTANDGKTYRTKFYNLDAILSIGYRVNSINATLFRIWATKTLKDYLLKDYTINQRVECLEYRVTETEKKIDFFVKTSLPPKEGIFYDGQIVDDVVYHIGASLKDLGKRLFAFSKMVVGKNKILRSL